MLGFIAVLMFISSIGNLILEKKKQNQEHGAKSGVYYPRKLNNESMDGQNLAGMAVNA